LGHRNVEDACWAWSGACDGRLHGDGIPIGHGIGASRCHREGGNNRCHLAKSDYLFHKNYSFQIEGE